LSPGEQALATQHPRDDLVRVLKTALKRNPQHPGAIHLYIHAVEAYFKTSPSEPMYRSAYYPHNIHFLMVSAQMGGDGASALQAATKLDAALAGVYRKKGDAAAAAARQALARSWFGQGKGPELARL
jgi:hypothetical protein